MSGPLTDWSWARARCLREARRLLGETPAAEDVVQEALLRAWRHRHACAAPHAPLPWLLAITRREALRWRDSSARAGAGEPIDDLVAPPAGLVQRSWSGDESSIEQLAVRDAIAALSADQRLLVRLRYGDDLTQPEIARRLGTPEGTVKIRLHRLRAQLREDLSG
ncbi:MAG: hypothetical protein QOC78_259 [Solirubrobacteraceae bacterium]|jgi:RNA polymerase sigma-70 factor (ECF subfamily)|nr:hypothetical protein [Solirubrobacteraceae bacterium]